MAQVSSYAPVAGVLLSRLANRFVPRHIDCFCAVTAGVPRQPLCQWRRLAVGDPDVRERSQSHWSITVSKAFDAGCLFFAVPAFGVPIPLYLCREGLACLAGLRLGVLTRTHSKRKPVRIAP